MSSGGRQMQIQDSTVGVSKSQGNSRDAHGVREDIKKTVSNIPIFHSFVFHSLMRGGGG